MEDNVLKKTESRLQFEMSERAQQLLLHSEFEVSCKRLKGTSSGHHPIRQLGVRLGDELIQIDVTEVASLIQSGVRFYVSRSGDRTYLRAVPGPNGSHYVETHKDGTPLDNLTSLPECIGEQREKKDVKDAPTDPIGVPVPEPEPVGKPGTNAPRFKVGKWGWLLLILFLVILVLLPVILNPAIPVISFASLPEKIYLDPDFKVSAIESDGRPVSFKPSLDHFCSVTEDGNVHILNAGVCAVTAYNPSNPHVGEVTQTFAINRKSQKITFAGIPVMAFSDPEFPLTAVADSTLSVSFSASGTCAVLEDQVYLLSAGRCTITAHQPGNENYLPAQDIVQSPDIGKLPQTIDFSAPGDQSLARPYLLMTATDSAGLPPNFASADPSICQASGNVVNLLQTGSCAITASQSGNGVYLVAPEVTQTFKITAAPAEPQTITFTPLNPTVFGSPDLAVNASASSGLAVSFTASGKCTVAGVSVKITGAGDCTITAHQDGDDRYQAAAPVSQTLVIAKATPVILWGDPDEILPGTPLGPSQLFAGARAVIWNAGNPYVVVSGTYRYTPGVGAILPPGVNPLHVVFIPDDTSDYNESEATVSILVGADHSGG